MADLAYVVGRSHAQSGRHSSAEIYSYAASLRVHPLAEAEYWRGFRDRAAGVAYTGALIAARSADHDRLMVVDAT